MYRNRFMRVALTALGTALFLGVFNSSPALSQSLDIKAFENTALSEHNTYRATHKSPSLNVKSFLTQTAQAHAERMANSGSFAHSSSNERNNAGENLFMLISRESLDSKVLANRAVQRWYEEVVDYNYENPGYSVATGHFTQVVWKSTTQLGCGVAKGRKYGIMDAYYVVCHYAAPGNVYGLYSENVLKP